MKKEKKEEREEIKSRRMIVFSNEDRDKAQYIFNAYDSILHDCLPQQNRRIIIKDILFGYMAKINRKKERENEKIQSKLAS